MMRRTVALSVVLVIALASIGWGAPQETAGAVTAQTPGSRLITYNGLLKDAEGRARTGSVAISFTLYAQPEGGDALWQESQTVVTDEFGRYTVLLGLTVPGGVPPEAFGDGKAQWLGVAVDGEAEQPRALLVAVPYALKAADADTLGGKPIASFVLSTDLEKAVEKQITSATTTATGGVGVVSGGVSPLGSEGDSNTFYGTNAGNGSMTGVYNSFFGVDSGSYTGSGTGNSAFGWGAGKLNVVGNDNTIFGAGAGVNNTASNNSFFGQNAGNANSTGTGNAFFGRAAGLSNTTGSDNSFFGFEAGLGATTGIGATCVGFQAGRVATGGYNTFVGSLAGSATTSGELNTYIGRRAGELNTTGSRNAGIGWYAGVENTTGLGNTFLGLNTGLHNTTENYNTFVGAYSAGAAGITYATAIGYLAQVTQSNSVVLGSVAGSNNATVTANVGIGTTAPTARLHVVGDVKVGDYLTGANNVVMGSGTALPTWSGNVELNNEAGVGFHFRALTAKFDIGPGGGGAPTYPGLLTLSMDGKVGIGTTSPTYKLHVVGQTYSTGGYVGSDLRLKDHVRDLSYGLPEVLRLRPVSYRWKDPTLGQPTLGLVAQEVQPVLPELVSRGEDEAGLLSLNYTGLIPVLIKAMQEQQAQKDAEIAALQARLAALEEQMARLVKQEDKPQPR